MNACIRSICAGLVTAITAACGGSAALDPSPSRTNVALGEEFDLRLGQTAVVGETGLRIRFADVAEDSRCAEDVVCVWAGNARVVLQIDEGTPSGREVAVNSTLDPRSVVVGSYRVRYIDLRPAPRAETMIEKRRYVVRLVVTPA